MEQKFEQSYTEQSSKHRVYFPIYDEIFKNNNISQDENYNILEIGVDNGSGVRALKKHFPNSTIYGLDILPRCKQYEEENIKIIIGSQTDNTILQLLKDVKFDIIIDDGSHHNNHVFYSYSQLFPSLSNSKVGIYIVEDTHTSYWKYYGGGYKNSNATIEKFKDIIDMQHAWCIRDPISCHIPPYDGINVTKTYNEEWVQFIQFYENIIVIKKRKEKAQCSKPI
jgi:23S rRNA U2552 (ribose-2'-O)-methylase RlmE/FtsJ